MDNNEDAKKRFKEYLDQNPDIKKAFKETIQELKKPENIEKMAKATAPYIEAILALRNKQDEKARSHRKENR